MLQEREAALKNEVDLLRYELQQQRIKMQENSEVIVSLQVQNLVRLVIKLLFDFILFCGSDFKELLMHSPSIPISSLYYYYCYYLEIEMTGVTVLQRELQKMQQEQARTRPAAAAVSSASTASAPSTPRLQRENSRICTLQ